MNRTLRLQGGLNLRPNFLIAPLIFWYLLAVLIRGSHHPVWETVDIFNLRLFFHGFLAVWSGALRYGGQFALIFVKFDHPLRGMRIIAIAPRANETG
jgi:hypothetical protein